MSKRKTKTETMPQETPAAAKPPKAPTKKQQVRDMLTAGPTTIAMISERLGVGPIAARALIGDVRKMGVKVDYDAASGAYRLAVALTV